MIKSGKTVLLAAHGNLLRGLIKNIDDVSGLIICANHSL